MDWPRSIANAGIRDWARHGSHGIPEMAVSNSAVPGAIATPQKADNIPGTAPGRGTGTR